jgi:hypothetical protein
MILPLTSSMGRVYPSLKVLKTLKVTVSLMTIKVAVPQEGGAETAQSKKGKISSKICEKARKRKEGAGDTATMFGDGAPLHSLTRHAVPIWTCGPYAEEVAETISHDARLRRANHPGTSMGKG